jgi:type IV pilus assembly protein PilE
VHIARKYRKSLIDVRRQIGFTLVELMVTVAIVGILASVAYPSYVKYVVKSNRAAAQSHLMDIAQQQPQYLIDNRAYAGSVSDLHLTTPDKVSSVYTITITPSAGPPPSYTVTASPIAGGAQADDEDLTITSSGAKTPAAKW